LSPSKPPKDPNEPITPNNLTTAGGVTSPDRLYDIGNKVSGIERSTTTLEAFASDAKAQLRDIEKEMAGFKPVVSNLEKCLERVESKLDQVRLDVHGAKKIAWAFGAVLSVIGTVGLLLLNKILDAVVHHFSK
jgi:hypothetical protein